MTQSWATGAASFLWVLTIVQSLSYVQLLAIHGLQDARHTCPPLSPAVCSDSWPLSWWCYPILSSSDALFSFCLQSFPAPGSFPMSQLFASGGQNIGTSSSASVLPMAIQDLFPLGFTGLISLQSILIYRSSQGIEETEVEWILINSRAREKLVPGLLFLCFLLWSLKQCCLSTWVLLALETLINEAWKKR